MFKKGLILLLASSSLGLYPLGDGLDSKNTSSESFKERIEYYRNNVGEFLWKGRSKKGKSIVCASLISTIYYLGRGLTQRTLFYNPLKQAWIDLGYVMLFTVGVLGFGTWAYVGDVEGHGLKPLMDPIFEACGSLLNYIFRKKAVNEDKSKQNKETSSLDTAQEVKNDK